MKQREMKAAKLIAAATAVLWSASSTSTWAKNWADGTGNWNVPGNWSPAALPASGEAVNIAFSDGVARTVTYNVAAPSLGTVSVDLTGAGTAASTLSLPNSFNLTENGLLIGGYNGSAQTAGRGAMNQAGGTVTMASGWDFVVGHGAGSTGVYTQSGGSVVANQSEYIGLSGNGTFNQSGGTNTIATTSGFFYLGTNAGSTGTYNLSGTGALVSNIHEYIGGSGTGVFNQTGGTNTVNSNNLFYIGFTAGGAGGTYALSAGTLSVAYREIIGSATSGTFNQSGGTNNVGDFLSLGAAATGTGTYTLSGGTLTAPSEAIGASGVGNFIQTGGTQTINTNRISIAASPGSSGTFTLSGGVTNVPGSSNYVVVGGIDQSLPGGTGVLNVSGTGVLNIGGLLQIVTSGASAVNLSGGTINTPALNFNSQPSRFHWTGGTLNLMSNITFDATAGGTTTAGAFGAALTLGANQTLMITGNETLGGTGVFALTLNAGSANTVSGAVTLSPTGTITQDPAATLSAATFTQAGGTVNGTLQNQGNFIYQSGAFNGRLLNQGTVDVGPGLTTANGVRNEGTIALAIGKVLTTDGAGLDNQGTIALSGGTLAGAGPLANNGLITGYGTIGGTNGFTNTGNITASGGAITLANSVGNANAASITVMSGMQLKLSGAALQNSGTVQLNGGNVSGSSALNNNAGGLIVGSGTISVPLVNNPGGTLLPQGGTVNLVQPLSNGGTIVLGGLAATLTGAAITNAGVIRGDGTIAGAVTNNSGGEIRGESGKTLLLSGTNGANAGNISLQGGTVEFSSALTNGGSGLITGHGYFYVDAPGGLTNSGQMQLSSGTTDVHANVTSTTGSKIIVSGGSTSTFYSPLVMQSGSEFRVSTGSTAVFFGMVNGTNFFTGTGTKDFESGSSALGPVITGGSTYVAQNASVTADTIRENSLSVDGNVTIPQNGTSTGTSKVSTLAVTGKLDLTNNKLIVTSGSVGNWTGSSYTGIEGLVASGRHGGSWNGPGIVTSQPDAAGASGLATLAVAANADLGKTTFGGESVSSSDVLVMYTYAGDANLDGAINGDDYFRIDGGYSANATGYANGDFNYDGRIDADDYFIIDRNYARQGTAFASEGVVSPDDIVAVPEPVVCGSVFVLMGAGALSRKRRSIHGGNGSG